MKTSQTYLLGIQLVLQIDAYVSHSTRKASGLDVSDAMIEVAGVEIAKPLLSVLIAALAVVFTLCTLTEKTKVSESKPVEAAATKTVTATSTTTQVTTVKEIKEEPKMVKETNEIVNRVEGDALDVVLVGCGVPKRGMGWYHLTQLLDMPNANVTAVVEPFFMNKKLCKTPPPAFAELVESLDKAGVKCTDSVAKLPAFTKDTMCLIAGRTSDNPALFKACVAQGAKTIYLEKPGAPSVAELEEMAKWAKLQGVKVYLGYNKNVTPYVQKALKLADTVKNSHVCFCHNNSYKRNELAECFSRNAEGMLKNMAIHELALLVSFFGVTVDTVKEFKVNKSKLFTEKLSVWVPGTVVPDEKYIADFSKIGFTVTTKDDKSVSVMADRCGGNVSFASVKDGKGMEVEKFNFPDKETQKKVEKQCAADPEMMPYFFVQSDDYFVLKDRVVSSTLKKTVAEGIATIEIGIEALKLAEYFTEEASEAIKN
jgi:predicted dehydrogenase